MDQKHPFPNPRYRLFKRLGEGGFGVVFLATDLFMGSEVAIKVLNTRSREDHERFRRELRLLHTQINNRHVVTVLDHDLDAETPYIVLEYCSGGSLRSWVEQRRPWRDVAAILTHALFGLWGVHRLGGFHRDLKPDNLLVAVDRARSETVVKVADFGLARVPVTSTGPMTQGLGGTPSYIAPEVLAGQPFTAAADIYSLGVVALELFTGSRTPGTVLPTTLPDSLRHLVAQMLAGRPEVRPDAMTIARRLSEILAAPAPVVPTAPVQQSASSGSGALAVLLGVGLFAGLAALAGGNSKEWDENVARYRGSDGRFRR